MSGMFGDLMKNRFKGFKRPALTFDTGSRMSNRCEPSTVTEKPPTQTAAAVPPPVRPTIVETGPSPEELARLRQQKALEEKRAKMERFRSFFNIAPPEPEVVEEPPEIIELPSGLPMPDGDDMVENGSGVQTTCVCSTKKTSQPADMEPEEEQEEVFEPGKGLARRMIDISDLY